MGLLHGLAFMSVYSVVSGAAQGWFPPHRRGLVAAVVARCHKPNKSAHSLTYLFSGYGFGSVMWIPMETAFVNPHNIAPTLPDCSLKLSTDCVEEKYFTDESVLKKSVVMQNCVSSLFIPPSLAFPTVFYYLVEY